MIGFYNSFFYIINNDDKLKVICRLKEETKTSV